MSRPVRMSGPVGMSRLVRISRLVRAVLVLVVALVLAVPMGTAHPERAQAAGPPAPPAPAEGPGSILPTLDPVPGGGTVPGRRPAREPARPLVSALLPISGLAGAVAVFSLLLAIQRFTRPHGHHSRAGR